MNKGNREEDKKRERERRKIKVNRVKKMRKICKGRRDR